MSKIEVLKNQMILDYMTNKMEQDKITYYSNSLEDERESRMFSQIKEVQLKVQELLLL